jgi:hypothetical protein
MRPFPNLSPPVPRQLSLLTDAPGLQGLGPEERREAVALLAALLIEASGTAAPEAGGDRG